MIKDFKGEATATPISYFNLFEELFGVEMSLMR